MNTIFDIELFFTQLSKSIIEVPSLRKDFEFYYNTDKYHFYERAKRSCLYDKVIGCLRGRKINFDYLGRSKNQELLEAEISAILQGYI